MKSLPSGWVWTRRGFGQDGCLYACRDTRHWPVLCPDLVCSSEAEAVKQARIHEDVRTGRLPMSMVPFGKVER